MRDCHQKPLAGNSQKTCVPQISELVRNIVPDLKKGMPREPAMISSHTQAIHFGRLPCQVEASKIRRWTARKIFAVHPPVSVLPHHGVAHEHLAERFGLWAAQRARAIESLQVTSGSTSSTQRCGMTSSSRRKILANGRKLFKARTERRVAARVLACLPVLKMTSATSDLSQIQVTHLGSASDSLTSFQACSNLERNRLRSIAQSFGASSSLAKRTVSHSKKHVKAAIK